MPGPAQPERILPAIRPYSGRRIALLTQHGKERTIAPVPEPALGIAVVGVATGRWPWLPWSRLERSRALRLLRRCRSFCLVFVLPGA